MPYEKLLEEHRIKPYDAKPREVERLLQVSARDLATAEEILPGSLDWSFNIVYNSVLQAARALMLHEGFRARGREQHLTVVRFCRLALGPEYDREVALFDQMRRKRNRLVYETVGLVSTQEVGQATSFARAFLETIRLRVTGQARLGLGDE